MSLIKLPQLNQPVSRHECDTEDITCKLQRIDDVNCRGLMRALILYTTVVGYLYSKM